MIRRARVLQDDFLPSEVVHRHDETKRLAAALEPVMKGDKPQHTAIFGPSGAGKTCVARYSLDQLREQILDVETQYVDCWQHHNRFRVLYKLLEGVSNTFDIHRSTPRDEMLARLEALETPYIVILDEVDQLEDASLLRELYAIPEITFVLIGNREVDFFPTLDERLQSRLKSSERIRFDQYTDTELVAILTDRVEWGLHPDAVTSDQLARIAKAADGDARTAIGILRSAARHGKREGVRRITDEMITEAIPEAQTWIRQQSVERLNEHQEVLYDIVVDAGRVASRELYQRYEDTVDDPKTKRTRRNYLAKLEHYNLVRSEGEGRGRVYCAVD